MAAQEYFNMDQPNGSSQQPQGAPAAPRPQAVATSPVQTAPNPPYPMYDGPPPPYSPGGLRADGAPANPGRSQSQGYPSEKQNGQHRLSQQFAPPQPRVQQRPATNGTSNGHIARPSLSQSQQDYDSQFRPPVRQQHSYYPPEKQAYPQSGPPYAPQQQQYYGSSLPVQNPYQNGGHADRKGHSVAFAPGRPQERYPSRSRSESRSRSRSRSRERDRERNSRAAQRKKSSGLNTFLGAGGGAILGDAIFPGLGTIGGALLGGFGGHEYDKNKKRARSHEVRPRERRHSDEYDHRPSRR